MRGQRSRSTGDLRVYDHVVNELNFRTLISRENWEEYATIEDKSTCCNWLVLNKADIVEMIEDWLRLGYLIFGGTDITYLYSYTGIRGIAAKQNDKRGTDNMLDGLLLSRPGGLPCLGASRMERDATISIHFLGWEQFVQVCLDIHGFLQPASAESDERWLKWEERFRQLGKRLVKK